MTDQDRELMMEWMSFLKRGMGVYREDPAPHGRLLCVGRIAWRMVMGAMDMAANFESALSQEAISLQRAFSKNPPRELPTKWQHPMMSASIGRRRLVRAIFEMEYGTLPHPWE